MIMIDVKGIEPLDHDEAMSLQAGELERTIAMLESLSPGDWTTQTECPDWDVRAMYLHVLGACEAGASMRENMHQMRLGRAHRKAEGGPLEAALSNVQVRERTDLSPDQLVEELRIVAPKTVKGRQRMPGLLRNRAKLAIDGPVVEKWPLGYLVDVVYLRDLWMHRMDVAQVTDHDPELTAEHDGRIVADVTAEWARRHGRPFVLELTGPAGGTYAVDADSPEAEHHNLGAVEFCRAVGGRVERPGLLATVVPF